MRIHDLITDPLLRLELATPSSQESLQAEIRSAVATESIDPAAYLSPGTLVLTTGMGLNFDDPRIWDGYVERLRSVDTAALAFGVGTPHRKVPPGLLEAAARHVLPILAVPADVPFLHLQNLVVRALSEEEHQAAHSAWAIAEECTKMAADGLEFTLLLEHVAARVGCVLRVVDDEGAVFTGTDQLPWSQRQTASEAGAAPTLKLPLNIGEDEQWNLLCLIPPHSDAVPPRSSCRGATRDLTTSRLQTVLTPATAVLGMVLSRSLSSGMHNSEKTDALLAALKRTDRHAPAEIVNALGNLGVDSIEGIRLVSVRARSRIRLHLLTWRLLRLLRDEVVVFPMEAGPTMLLALVPFADVRWSETIPGSFDSRSASPLPLTSRDSIPSSLLSTTPLTTGESSYLDLISAVINPEAGDLIIVSEPAGDVSALALFTGLYADPEVRTAAQAHRSRGGSRVDRPVEPGAGVHFAGQPDLTDLAALIPPMYSSGLAHAVLGPILDHRNRETLLASLATFVESPSVAQAAARLGVHRNTARAHRTEIEEALGIDLSSGDDRSLCALALALLD